MKKPIFYFLSILLFFWSCNTKTNVSDNKKNNSDSLNNTNVLKDNITIVGAKVNIRESPGTKANVLFQLNSGDSCNLLEKGKFESIKGKGDFWYKIKYNEKTGWVFGAFTSLAKPAYALIYTIGDVIYLFGKFNLNEVVTLIDNKTGYMFETATTSYHTENSENFGQFVLTKIKNQPETYKGSDFIAMFIKKPDDYRNIDIEKTKDKDLINKIDKLIRKSNYLETLLDKNVGGFITEVNLKNITPDVFMFKCGNTSVNIATYKFKPETNYPLAFGPRLAVVDDIVFPLTGPCSYEEFYVFYLNSKYYIETGAHCCVCGVTGVEIFEIADNKVLNVFSDYSYSD
jgi:hypothetical protein